MTTNAHLRVPVGTGTIKQVDQFVAGFAARHGLGEDERARALIVIEELLTNLLKYGYQERKAKGAADITLLLDDGRLTIEIIDDGGAFNPFTASEPDFNQPLEAQPPGGLGLRIVRLLTEGKYYSRLDNRNVTRLTLRLSPASAA